MKKVKKLLLLILIPILLLTTIIVLDSDVYAVNDDRPIDEVIVANVEYYDGFVSLSPVPATVINDIWNEANITRVLYIAFFDRDVSFRISSTISGDNIIYEVRFLAIVFDLATNPNDEGFKAFVTLYDKNGDIILDNDYRPIVDTYQSPAEFSFDAHEYNVGFFQDGFDHGYWEAKQWYAYYDNGEYYTGNYAYVKGYDEAGDYYGINHDGNLLTAEQWGEIRYGDGYGKGSSDEIDWWSWSTTFFLMPFRILNIEILPGVKIGYFALFSLLIGVVGWFFFIVGKGGGRRK